MVETTINPSELHLKKELNILRKAHFLCDPETSSWRSSFTSNSLTANTALHLRSNNAGDPVLFDNPSQLQDTPPKSKREEKKVYLYNWGNHSSKSMDSWPKLDEEKKKELITESVINGSDTINAGNFSEVGLASKVSRVKYRRGASSRRQFVKYSSKLKADCQSTSGGLTSSTDLSEDNESSNSSKLVCGNKSNPKDTSDHASPVLSRSRYGNMSLSSKFMQCSKRDGLSSTSASPKSQSIGASKNKSCHGSQDGSRYDWYRFKQLHQQGCMVPCYWPKRKKGSSSRSSYSSLFDTPSKKFGAILRRGQFHSKRFSTSLNKDSLAKSLQSSPLLINSFDGYDSSTEVETDLSAYMCELDLEGRSRLDGERWSTNRKQEESDLDIAGISVSGTSENGSLSRKYRPRVFSDIVGQSIIVQSLENAILTGKIAPAYLFQGSRGTGKSSTARVFAAALNCTSFEQSRPCGLCSECIRFASGNGSNVTVVDSKNKKDVGILKLLLKNACCASMFSQCKVFVIENCHTLSTKLWFEFMKCLEQPLPCIVFIFISFDAKSLPRSVVSRCQKYVFGKIKDTDIATRLHYICTEEKVDFDLEAIDLISSHSDGSLKDAEAMLHQLTVLNRRISTSLVYGIVGLVSEEKLIDLLEIAISSNTKKTVRRCRELLNSGVDPVAIMSQLAGLIVDIITGAYQLSSLQTCQNTATGQRLSEVELGRMQNALKILSDAEKRLTNSSERSTWFTAAILQLASSDYADISLSSSTSSKDAEMLFEEPLEKEKGAAHPQYGLVPVLIQESDRACTSQTPACQSSLHDYSSNRKSTSNKLAFNTCQIENFSVERDNIVDTRSRDASAGLRIFRCVSPEKLDVVWQKCINRCRSETLRKLLANHGKLVSVTSVEGVLIAYIAFGNGTVKSRAERFLSSITNSIEIVLKRNVEVRIGIVPENFNKSLNSMPESTITGKIGSARVCSSDNFQHNSSIILPTNLNNPECFSKKKLGRDNNACEDEGFLETADLKGMECAGLESTKKVEQTHLLRDSSTEKALPIPENGQTQREHKSPFVQSISLRHWQRELNNEIEELESDGSHLPGNSRLRRDAEWYNIPISPSLLHSNSLRGKFDQAGINYDSSSVRNGNCCWRGRKSEKRKVSKGSNGRRNKEGCFLCFMPPSS